MSEGEPAGSRHLPPFHCPYCGDEDLTPYEGGGWRCAACLRAFRVTLIATGVQQG